MKINSNFKEANLYYIKSNFQILISKLCVRLLNNNLKILINTKNKLENSELDKFLWVNDNNSFIPHISFDDPELSEEKLVLFYGNQINFERFKKFDVLIFSPSVMIKKLKIFTKFFLFSYNNNNSNYHEHKLSLEKKGFKVKIFLEQENFKWKNLQNNE
ncbi:MAG: hypothetical protein CMN00_00150 [Rickettsiales bacterium]|nr:hypothetical protein [Rickettsiales bacterium]